MRSKFLIAVAVIAGIIVIGFGVGFLAGHGSTTPPPVSQRSSPGANARTLAPDAPTDTQTTLAQNPPLQPIPAGPPAQTSNASLAASNSPALNTNWEDKIDDIVGSDDPDTNKVKQLFALFPTLPPDGQEEVVQHLSNLVEDDNYAPLGDMLKNPKLSEGVLDELLADALNRPNSLKLPVLLDVAQEPDNAKHDEAKDLLELYLGQDYGTNWSDWQANMNTWMQQNPD